ACADAKRNGLSRSGDVLEPVLVGQLCPQRLAVNGVVPFAVELDRRTEQLFDETDELASNLTVVVREPALRRVPKASLGDEVSEQDGLVLAEPVAAGCLDSPEKR